MNFLFTNYVYPIKSKICISENNMYFLDNPRTDEELNFVKDKIKNYHQKTDHFRFPPRANSKYVSLTSMLKNIRKYYRNDEYLQFIYKEHFSSKSFESIYSFLARIWIIARYNDEGRFDEMNKLHQEMIEKGKRGFFLIDDDDPIEKNANLLVDYSYILSILCNTQDEEYNGISFINERSDYKNEKTRFMQSLLFLDLSCHYEKKDKLDWLVFPKIKSNLLNISLKIDDFIKTNGDSRLKYIGNLLSIIGNDVSNTQTQIVLLTSIIEFILTRNPDFNRFNVEDSISKQFQLKTMVVIHQYNSNYDLKEIKSNLQQIYKIRSCIAHGNIDDLNLIIEKEKSRGKEYYLESIRSILYHYIRIILEVYLNDCKFIETLKMS